MKSLAVLLVDDHPAVRQGLTLLLEAEGIGVCAEADNQRTALAQAQALRPALAIVDLSLDGEDGLELVNKLSECGVPVLVYSMHDDVRRVRAAFEAGAQGYVTKREFHKVLIDGIRETAARRRYVSPAAAAALAEGLGEPDKWDVIEKLSPNEREVYRMLGAGASTTEIAAALDISNHTVESYCQRIKVKLHLGGMHELRRHAIGHNQKPEP